VIQKKKIVIEKTVNAIAAQSAAMKKGCMEMFDLTNLLFLFFEVLLNFIGLIICQICVCANFCSRKGA